jgi:16S rRNA (guanine966-N2)-methyltransferase
LRIIAGRWRGRRLGPLRGRSVRPTTDRVREAWMSALGGTLDDLRVLDLFAGSGALGLEALSRGAREVVFVEKAASSLKVLAENIRLLGAEEQSRILKADAIKYERGLEPFAFDVALADPPYDEGHAATLLELFHERPFANELWVEHRTKEAVPAYEGLRQRRYGDTTLSTLIATADE